MPQDRFYWEGDLISGHDVTLDKEEDRHLQVMRKRPGDQVELVNGRGALALGSIVSKNVIHINSVTEAPENPFELIIAQAMPRFSRLDAILEKGTELGLTSLWLFPGEKSEKTTFSDNQKERMDKILIAAMKQCGSLYLPKLEIWPGIKSWTSLPYPAFFGDVKENAPSFYSSWKQMAPEKGALFVIGPESGLTNNEEKHLQTMHAKGVTLHKNILRTDTAPLAALTLMSHFLADIL